MTPPVQACISLHRFLLDEGTEDWLPSTGDWLDLAASSVGFSQPTRLTPRDWSWTPFLKRSEGFSASEVAMVSRDSARAPRLSLAHGPLLKYYAEAVLSPGQPPRLTRFPSDRLVSR